MSVTRRIKDVINDLAKQENPWISALPRWAKSVKRNRGRRRYQQKVRQGNINFVTLDELANWTREWIRSFPTDFDVIIGIPRSGMIVASMIACRLGRPLTTPDLYCEGKWWASQLIKPTSFRRALLVDDSVNAGMAIARARATLAQGPSNVKVTTAAVVAHRREARELVDLHYRLLLHPTIFEWNLLHMKAMNVLSVSLEGVLCDRLPQGVSLASEGFAHWAAETRCLQVPSYEIDFVISMRGEQLRDVTQRWLARHGVRYRELLLVDAANKDASDRKVALLRERHPDMHFEDTRAESEKIWQATGIPTICFDEMDLINYSGPTL
jgi:hypoxanthine phosphoribosyltransferase